MGNISRCRICGEVAQLTSWKSIECASCSSIYAAQIPTVQELSIFYEKYNDHYSGGGSSGGRNQLLYAQKYLDLVTQRIQSGDLIDIGCANNPFPNVASEHGFSVTAMDYSCPGNLTRSVTFKNGHLNDQDLLAQDKKYDVVTAWAVIEHVRDPNLAFEILSHLVKPEGLIFLTTPENGTILTNSSAGRTPWFYPPEHLHLLSPKAIAILANKNGLTLLNWGHFEISKLRWMIRYGIGLIEFLFGIVIGSISRAKWTKMRSERKQKFTGIAWYIIKRTKAD